MNSPKKRKVVVVLGMPRSGTSLLANLLHVMGVNLGNNLVKANEDNPEGYWENEDISRLQKQIIELGIRLGGPDRSLLAIPPKYWNSPEFDESKQQLRDLVAKELEQSPGLWGFKDSRTTRILPIWKEVFQQLGLEPVYLLALRNPLAVAASMAKLWETSPGLGQLMWLTHNVDALAGTGRQVRLVVDYDRWFSHPTEQLAALAAALGLEPKAVGAEVLSAAQARLKPGLRHNQGDLSQCLPWVAEMYALLQAAAIDGKLSPRLVELEERVQGARVFVHHCLAGMMDSKVAEAAARREEKIQHLDKVASERDATIAQLNHLCSERDATIAQLNGLCSERDASIAELNRLCSERDATIAGLTRLSSERDATIANLDRLCNERGATITTLDRLCRERQVTIDNLEKLIRERDEVSATMRKSVLVVA
jgi:hypothetical protein